MIVMLVIFRSFWGLFTYSSGCGNNWGSGAGGCGGGSDGCNSWGGCSDGG